MKDKKIRKRFILSSIIMAVYQLAVSGNAFSGSMIQVEAAEDEIDQEFEDYLTEQGFPESYKEGLRTLHEEHPNWVFQAFQTGLEWDTVIENEMTFRRNLVPDLDTYPSSYKDTTISGSYDWVNDQWMILSDPHWVQASQAAVEYYMDPRNFFTEENMFQFELETFNKEVQNLEGVEKILDGTFMSHALVDDTRVATVDNAYIISDVYTVKSTYLCGLQEKTTVKELLSGLTAEEGDLRVTNAKGIEKDLTDYVGTGDQVQVIASDNDADSSEEEIITSCTVWLMGDIDGNGKIDTVDRAYLKAYVYGSLQFTSLQMTVADVNQDGSVDALDRAYLKAYMYGTLEINQTIEDTSMTYGELFMKIGEELNVSPYMLASRVRQEQGSGTSDLISGTVSGYEGYYNYFNINASGTTREEIIKNGMEEAKSNGWDSRYKAIVGGATKLCEGHIWKGQDTLYLQKFDVEGEYYGYYWHQYMQNLLAGCSEGYSVYKTYKNMDALETDFVFKIPVYENMPEEACPQPTQDGNPNYKLKSLTIKKYEIDFDRDVYDYYIDVPKSVKKLKISAEAYASTTTIEGTGDIAISSSTSKVIVQTDAENGETKEYIIHLNRT